MITEKQFALGFSGFWQGLLPMLERHVRAVNLNVRRIAPPVRSQIKPAAHGIVNELAFRLFAAASASGDPIDSLSTEAIESAIGSATAHIRGLRQLSRTPIRGPETDELREAMALAKRHVRFFRRKGDLKLLPGFPGCGWLSECAGDVLAKETLFEVKSGQRGFRSTDLRQVLVYCALNFAAKDFDISQVCLVNPRVGVYLEEDLEELCGAASGASAVEVLAAIVEYCSESQDRYQIG